ncbi:hypothetical protein CYLTODRAFT_495570 [Cylindrobasidium torrendii FP15055 ss-10]|uniref:Uncharacterized protein n=1 Tax=Cylindrobasidium torrendii FP15055 ss-10 TaxID=1314674 RepID=A0A0D7AQU3_9AGAR|nr:hypothetical protein CYLTODRAFT_495570 [Cylindrobasidium torrendii FP15055 ss-10]
MTHYSEDATICLDELRDVPLAPPYVFFAITSVMNKWYEWIEAAEEKGPLPPLRLSEAHSKRVKEMQDFAVEKIGLFQDMPPEEYNHLKFEGLDPKTERCFKEAMGTSYTDDPMPLMVDTGKKDRDGK